MKIRLIILAAILCSWTITEAKGLKETTKEFIKVVENPQISQDEFISKLSQFIIPHANLDSMCVEYYQHWKACNEDEFFAIETKIEKISKSTNDDAIVLISNIWKSPTGEEYYCLTKTNWVRKDKVWYRTTDDSEMLVDQQINVESYMAANQK